MATQASSSGGFICNTVKSETCKVIELRNKALPSKPKVSEEKKGWSGVEKKNGKEVVAEEEVEKHLEGEKSWDTSEDEVRGYTIDQFIDKNSLFRITEKKILNEQNHE